MALFGSLALMLFLFRESDLGTAYWVFTVMLPSINLLVFPLIQTLSSDSLRRDLRAFLQKELSRSAISKLLGSSSTDNDEMSVVACGYGEAPSRNNPTTSTALL